jgi:hypothetical protein
MNGKEHLTLNFIRYTNTNFVYFGVRGFYDG